MAFTFSKDKSVQMHPGHFVELAQRKLTGLGVLNPTEGLLILRPISDRDRREATVAVRTATHIFALHKVPKPQIVIDLEKRLEQ